ncbi:MAG: hypothetical protein HY902_09175 [Deltaproteobacteria bacterium]|nr:hypothetical protein [Deltaproteobacteria bacterium]
MRTLLGGVAKLGMIVAVLLVACPAVALPPPPAVPPLLEPWQPWVLHDEPDLLCASLGNDSRVCAWPGHLVLQASEKAGSFELDVWLDHSALVGLPGDKTLWPQDVRLDGQPALVQASSAGVPQLRVPAGHHQVTGALPWHEIPEILALPGDVAVVELTLRGAPVEHPRRDDVGRLLLQKDGAAAAETDSLSITVARRLEDGVPLRQTTRLTLRVGGKAREVLLGPVLNAGFRPTHLTSPIPAQLGGDGALRVHVRPGTHTVEICSVLAAPVAAIAVMELSGDMWELPETWVWQPDETLRSVELSGLAAVDPERTQLADDWKKGRCLVASPGQSLTLKVTRRGEQQAPPNQLNLQRDWWLDLDGQGLTSRDHLTGTMHQGWQLQASAGWQLGHVAVGGQDQLVTLGEGATAVALSGAELRTGNLNVDAELRMKGPPGELRAVGWNADVQSLRTTLHLPPGWTLLSAHGVDHLPRTWLDSWTLFDFFFILLVTIGFGRLLGWLWGGLWLLALVLCHDQFDAPQVLWIFALIGLGLLAVLPAGRFRQVVVVGHALVLVSLVSVAIGFAAGQLRHGLYPQVPGSDGFGVIDGLVQTERADLAPMAAPPAPEAAAGAAQDLEQAAQAGEKKEAEAAQRQEAVLKLAESDKDSNAQNAFQVVSRTTRQAPGKKAKWSYGNQNIQQIDPQAVVQTGPGVPTWHWSSWQLGWSGPVRADHTIELWLLSPRANLVLAVLRALLVLLLSARLLDLGRLKRWLGTLQVGPETGILLAALLLPSLWPQPVQATEAPPSDVLDTLHKRLVAAQQCEGPCLVASQLELRADGQQLKMIADVSAQRPAAWVIPGPGDAADVRRVLIDDQPTRDLRRGDDGLLQVRVPTGYHRITVEALLPRRAVIDLQLGAETLAHRVRFVSSDWNIDGLDPAGVPQQSAQLTRREAPAALPGGATAAEGIDSAVDLPPWFRVERQLHLGLPWQVHTVVRREVSDRPLLVKVPLLPGEVVLTDGVRVEEVVAGQPDKGRRVLVNFARGVDAVEFDGQLPMPDGGRADFKLEAPRGEPWTETWSLECSAIWRCSHQGLAPDHSRDPDDAVLRPLWRPYPGEAVAVHVDRPRGAPGQSITIDSVTYRVTPGQRLLSATLTLQVRASQGGWQKLTLPAGADVQTVTCAGKPRNLRPDKGVLQIPLEVGRQQVVVAWQQPWDRSLGEHVPELSLGGPAANVTVELLLGADRWLLWTRGPAWGAAVLFWSRFALVLLAALALGRLRGLPLQTRHWLGLALGLAPLPPLLALAVVGWVVVVGWRRRYGLQGWGEGGRLLPNALHNLLQLALAGWTLFAMATLYGAIHQNLLLDVDMQVAGMNSTGTLLRWYVDRIDGALPAARVWSLPLWVWRALMLGWALWLVLLLTKLLPWAWRAYASGALWRHADKQRVPAAEVAPPPTPPPAGRAPLPPAE